MMITFKTIALTCTVATLVVSAPAMANVKTKQVRYSDLDLSTATGQQRLANRVEYAVKSVCNNPRAFSLAEKLDLARCKKDASASVMPKVERTVARYQEAKRLATNEPIAVVGN